MSYKQKRRSFPRRMFLITEQKLLRRAQVEHEATEVLRRIVHNGSHSSNYMPVFINQQA